MATMLELKGRIGSVSSTQKITGAMKTISSAKLQKAESLLTHARPFRSQLQNTINNLLSTGEGYLSPLSEERPLHKAAIVIFGSNEGLCGAFNSMASGLLSQKTTELKRQGASSVTVYVIGKKIKSFVSKIKGIELADTSYFSSQSGAASIKQLAEELMSKFLGKEYDRVEVIYYRFKSISSQKLTDETFLPIQVEADDTPVVNNDYIFEPDSKTIYQTILPLFVHATLYDDWLQNQTSEQAARIIAMQTANDNANKLLEELQLDYNKLRQQNITNELLDIAGGSIR